MPIGERVRECRQSKKLTQQRLAEKANLSITAVQKIEQGVHIPNLRTLEAIAAAMGMEVAMLLAALLQPAA